MITWITEAIAIGEYLDVCNREVLLKEKIDCIVNLRVEECQGERILAMQNGIAYFELPVGYIAGEELDEKYIIRDLDCAVACLIELIVPKYNRIVVHCTAGMDRSPFVVARYLVWKGLAQTMVDAYKIIKKKRPQIMEHLEWVR